MNEQHWNFPNSPWKDEKAYLNWLRSSVRRVWSRHPCRIAYKQARRYKAPVGKNGKEVFVSNCEMCGKQHRACEVDHLRGGFGFTDWTSFTEWAKMVLWVSFDDIRELCPDCHATVTLSQRKGISFEEAQIEKLCISLVKEKKDLQWLKERSIIPASTQAKRREQIKQKLMEEQHEVAD